MVNEKKTIDFTKFDVEHGMNIFASSYAIFPAACIYEDELVEEIRQCSKSFHIYLIGYVPKMNVKIEEESLHVRTIVDGKRYIIEGKIPCGAILIRDGNFHYLQTQDGERELIDTIELMRVINSKIEFPFIVKYIGQAFGTDGSRDAFDRLMHHETLQRISVKGIPDDHELYVILLEIQIPNRIITIFNPNSENKDDDETRIGLGLDKLYETTKAEKVSLYEAALIRYFSPEFNKEFKDSFPSTNLKILKDCYSKDILMLVSEICIEGFPVCLCSESIQTKRQHIITQDLQKDSERKLFFGMNA